MKFQFRFEKILRHKKAEENIARRDYVEAQKKVDMEMDRLSCMADQLSEAYVKRSQKQAGGGVISENLREWENFIKGTELRIEQQKEVIQGLDEILESKRDRMILASQETKKMEKLKERKLSEFKQEVKKKELKYIDNVNVMYAKRGYGHE